MLPLVRPLLLMTQGLATTHERNWCCSQVGCCTCWRGWTPAAQLAARLCRHSVVLRYGRLPSAGSVCHRIAVSW